MMQLTSLPALWQKLLALSDIHAGTSVKTSDSEQFMEIRQAAQEVLFENIWSHPEAFSSELEVYYQAHLCRGLE